MAKGKRKRKGSSGGGPPSPDAILAELETRVQEITTVGEDGAGPLWGAAHKLMLKLKVDPAEGGRIIATRDIAALQRLIAVQRGEDVAPEPEETPAAPTEEIPPDTMKKAMRAFRKRVKLIRLDHESRLGVGPMTGGKKADFDAIIPPQEYSRAVWDALVAAGQLKSAGQGFYMLAESASETD